MVSPRTTRVSEHQRVANRYILATQPAIKINRRPDFAGFLGGIVCSFPPFSVGNSLLLDYSKGIPEPFRATGMPVAQQEKRKDSPWFAPRLPRRFGSETNLQGYFL